MAVADVTAKVPVMRLGKSGAAEVWRTIRHFGVTRGDWTVKGRVLSVTGLSPGRTTATIHQEWSFPSEDFLIITASLQTLRTTVRKRTFELWVMTEKRNGIPSTRPRPAVT
jgi:hypothetical protein